MSGFKIPAISVGVTLAAILVAVIIISDNNIDNSDIAGYLKEQRKITQNLKEIESLRSERNYDEALKKYQEIRDIDPENLIAYRGIGDIYLLLGKAAISYEYHQKGFDLASKKIGADPMPFKIGMANAMRLVDPSRSIQLYSQVLQNEKTNINALNGLSQSYLLLNDLESAELNCRKSLGIKPEDNNNAKVACANVLREKGEYGSAIQEYQSVLQVDPDHSMALFGLGSTQFKIGNYQDALEYLQRGIQNTRYYDPEILVIIGDSYEKVGDIEAAVGLYQRASQQLSEDHFNHALIRDQLETRMSLFS